MHQIDNDIFKRYNDPELCNEIKMHWESINKFLKTGLGYCLAT